MNQTIWIKNIELEIDSELLETSSDNDIFNAEFAQDDDIFLKEYVECKKKYLNIPKIKNLHHNFKIFQCIKIHGE